MALATGWQDAALADGWDDLLSEVPASTAIPAPPPVSAPLTIPALPTGFNINQPRDQRHDVYTGPGKSYYQVKVNEKGVYTSTNGWIKAYARDGDWLLIEYAISSGSRMGYVPRVNSKGQEIKDFYAAPELPKASLPIRMIRLCILTDDPNVSGRVLFEVPENLRGVLLCDHGGRWGYVELTINGELVRGFVDCENYALD